MRLRRLAAGASIVPVALMANANPAWAHDHQVVGPAGSSVAWRGATTAVVLALAGVALASGLLDRERSRSARLVPAVAAGIVLAEVARRTTTTPVGFAVMWAHVATASLWLGGLLVIAVRRRREDLAVFARWAAAATVAVVVTGVLNVNRHVGSVADAARTPYGRVLVAKLVLVTAAVGLGVLLRRGWRPTLPRFEVAALLGAAGLAGTLGVLPLGQVPELPADRPFTAAMAADVGGRLGAHLVAGGRRRVVLIGDGSPRAAAFEQGLVSGGVTVGPDGDAVVVAGSRVQAASALAALRSPTRVVLLAPWLLDAGLLRTAVADPSGGQVALALPFDPFSAPARSYLAAAAAADRTPTGEGLLGWLAAAGGGAATAARMQPASLQLFTPARVAVLPKYLDHGHDDGDGWLPAGGLAPVSAVLR